MIRLTAVVVVVLAAVAAAGCNRAPSGEKGRPRIALVMETLFSLPGLGQSKPGIGTRHVP